MWPRISQPWPGPSCRSSRRPTIASTRRRSAPPAPKLAQFRVDGIDRLFMPFSMAFVDADPRFFSPAP
jgi:hypothetical protein